jgi:hypothetical protein
MSPQNRLVTRRKSLLLRCYLLQMKDVGSLDKASTSMVGQCFNRGLDGYISDQR